MQLYVQTHQLSFKSRARLDLICTSPQKRPCWYRSPPGAHENPQPTKPPSSSLLRTVDGPRDVQTPSYLNQKPAQGSRSKSTIGSLFKFVWDSLFTFPRDRVQDLERIFPSDLDSDC
jgi:hypothetical protein